MTFWFRKHHYKTQIWHTIMLFRYWYNIKGFMRGLMEGDRYVCWLAHLDDCCNYWQPVDLSDPATKRAFMLDDDFQLTAPTSQEGIKDE